MTRRGRPRHPDVLTPRQWEVLELIRRGLTNEQIAREVPVYWLGSEFEPEAGSIPWSSSAPPLRASEDAPTRA